MIKVSEDLDDPIDAHLYLNDSSITFGFIPFHPLNGENDQYQLLLSEAIVIRKRLSRHGFHDSSLATKSREIKYLSQNSAEVYLPVVLLSSQFLAEHPNFLSVFLGVISNFATEALMNIFERKYKNEVEFKIVIKDESTGKLIQINYEGSADKLKDIDVNKIIRDSR